MKSNIERQTRRSSGAGMPATLRQPVKWHMLVPTGAVMIVLTGLVAHAAEATIITNVFDTFTDGGRSNGTDALDTEWYAFHRSVGGTAPTIATRDDAPLSGNVLSFSGTSAHGFVGGGFGPTTLLQSGDYIELSFDYRNWGEETATASGPQVGLYNSRGTALSQDWVNGTDPTTETGDDDGYKITKFAAVSTSDFKIMEQTNLGNNFRNSIGTQLALTDSGLTATPNGGKYAIGMRITLADNLNDLIITGWFDDYSTGGIDYTTSYTDVNGANDFGRTFDMAYIMGSSGENSVAGIQIDNILVTYVPEPARGTLIAIQ